MVEETVVISKVKAMWLSGFLEGLSTDRGNVDRVAFEEALDKARRKFDELIEGINEQSKTNTISKCTDKTAV